MPKRPYIRKKPYTHPSKGCGTTVKWLFDNANYKGDDCLIWPFSRASDGRGNFGLDGKMHRAHRFMCILVNGPPPTDKHHAAHSCGRGADACVHPEHLSWKTQSENELDKYYLHGLPSLSKGNRTKIPLEVIADIRANKGRVPVRMLTEKYNLKRGIVRYWQDSIHEPTPPGTSRTALRRRRLGISQVGLMPRKTNAI